MSQQQPIKKSVRLGKPCDFCGDKIREWSGEMRCWSCNALYDSAGDLLKSPKQQKHEATVKKREASLSHFARFAVWVICTFFVPVGLLNILGETDLIPEAYETWVLWGFGIWVVAGFVYGAKHDLIPHEAGSGE